MQIEYNRSVERNDISAGLQTRDIEPSDKRKDAAFRAAGTDDNKDTPCSGGAQRGNRARRNRQIAV